MNDLIRQYQDLKKRQKEIDDAIGQIKEQLVALINRHGPIEYDGQCVELVEFTREYFKLVDAKKVIDNRLLKPYITVSNQTRIKIRKAA